MVILIVQVSVYFFGNWHILLELPCAEDKFDCKVLDSISTCIPNEWVCDGTVCLKSI